ncbi:hypothetical protein [Mucilaginibacter myungsuensis]|uniref:Lipoprotein n=1 Tax=Mucilaginibacter myungsuensis TaxID=649104 RepID=A0A929L4K9_9SPHI|nr:hypothetical protein [Mucilaginibacter myungsuensis]MBE9664364.1 hypothetical protein [Mucilaginibacter myungsuensis]MDN3597074.1 hypothetical protein [Mucilaginibacter myungsuensis]
MRKLLYLLPFLLLGCTGSNRDESEVIIPANWQQLGLDVFTIRVPGDWMFEQPGGFPYAISGKIAGPNVLMGFDLNTREPIDRLPLTEKEYLATNKWWKEVFAFYVSQADKEIKPITTEQKKKYPKASYIAYLKYGAKTGILPIELPEDIAAQNFKVDSNDKYVYKTTWPKVAGKGVTGIYIRSRSSAMNFQLSGSDLAKKDQESALLAFKTVKFKHDQQ